MHRPKQRGQEALSPKCSEYLVILCFERRCPKQNTLARQSKNPTSPQKKYFGLPTPLGEYTILETKFEAWEGIFNTVE